MMEVAFLYERLRGREKQTIVDCGGGRGVCCTLPLYLGVTYVHSFEPHPGLFRFIGETIARVQPRYAWAYNVALWNQGAMQLTLRAPKRTEKWTLGTFGNPGRFSAADAQTFTVEMSTVDAEVKRRNMATVDLIKIDVEGSELQVLQGAQATIAEHRPALFVEIYGPNLEQLGTSEHQVRNLIKSWGYHESKPTTGHDFYYWAREGDKWP